MDVPPMCLPEADAVLFAGWSACWPGVTFSLGRSSRLHILSPLIADAAKVHFLSGFLSDQAVLDSGPSHGHFDRSLDRRGIRTSLCGAAMCFVLNQFSHARSDQVLRMIQARRDFP